MDNTYTSTFRAALKSLSILLGIFVMSIGASPASSECVLDGIRLPDGGAQTFFSSRSVGIGQECEAVSGPRRCAEGALKGRERFQYGKCTELEGFLGVNTNRRPEDLEPALLERTGADWIRTMVDVLVYKEQYDTGTFNPKRDFADWNVYLAAAAGKKRKAILNLMWDFRREGIAPPKPGSKDEEELFAYLDAQILDALISDVDILVTGNELFVDSRQEDWQYNEGFGGIPIVLFYQRVTEHVHSYLVEKGLRNDVDLYLGAFTRLHTKKMQQQPAVNELLNYAENTPYVDGLDLHAHVNSVAQIEKILSFVRRYTDKPLTVSEFTFVWAMKQGLQKDTLGREFADRWGYQAKTRSQDYLSCDVYGVSKGCRGKGPVSKEEWDDFMGSRDWYIDHFILLADEIFQKYGVRGATFGLTSPDEGLGKRRLDPNRPPWYLGGLFAPTPIKRLPDGSAQPNYQYLDDFLEVQRQRDSSTGE